MKKILAVVLALVLVLAAAAGLYINDYYRTDAAQSAAVIGDLQYGSKIWDDGTLANFPEDQDYDAAVIFYPGGKVEYTAYEPLMALCAREGVLCLLVEMPGNLAVLDMNAAERVRKLYPEVEHWYLAGHSLGGSMAASFAAEHDWVDGVILLAAYSTADLGETPVLSIYGSEDQVMNREKYDKYRENLPDNCTEVILAGGNHAFFGVYGPQEGDGEATISNQDQIIAAAERIVEFVMK